MKFYSPHVYLVNMFQTKNSEHQLMKHNTYTGSVDIKIPKVWQRLQPPHWFLWVRYTYILSNKHKKQFGTSKSIIVSKFNSLLYFFILRLGCFSTNQNTLSFICITLWKCQSNIEEKKIIQQNLITQQPWDSDAC